MSARIYQPAPNAMQSGRAKSRHWVLEFTADKSPGKEPLMGWTRMRDTCREVRLRFDTREQAEDYARKHGIAYEVAPAHKHAPRRKSYADNFRWGRPGNWTH